MTKQYRVRDNGLASGVFNCDHIDIQHGRLVVYGLRDGEPIITDSIGLHPHAIVELVEGEE